MKKKKIAITIEQELINKIEKLASNNKSKLIEYILLDYLVKLGYEIKDLL
jgi:hypothetical protein